jgi:hypothetical protein
MPQRRQGRPRRGEGPFVPWQEVDRLLVFGEVVRDEKTGNQDLRYPSFRELGRRFSVSASLIGQYATRHQCLTRREENRAKEQRQFEQKLIEKRAEARALSKIEEIGIIDDYLRRFKEALDEGRVRFDSPGDFNTMARLKEFLEGNVDSRQEVQGQVSLDQVQMRHRALREQIDGLDPALTGAVIPMDEGEAAKGGISTWKRPGGTNAGEQVEAPGAGNEDAEVNHSSAGDAPASGRVVH